MNLQELEDIYDKIQRERKNLHVSPTAFKFLQDSKIDLFGITVQSTPLLPFETYWDACDVETHEKVKIASGEWVHAILMPEPSWETDLVEEMRVKIKNDMDRAFYQWWNGF